MFLGQGRETADAIRFNDRMAVNFGEALELSRHTAYISLGWEALSWLTVLLNSKMALMETVNVIVNPLIIFTPFDHSRLMLYGYLPAGEKDGAYGNNGFGGFVLVEIDI
jgi:hypothetical protein